MGRHAQALPGKTSKKGVCSLTPSLEESGAWKDPLSLRPYCQVPDAGTVKRSTTLRPTQALQKEKILKQVIVVEGSKTGRAPAVYSFTVLDSKQRNTIRATCCFSLSLH